MEDYSTLFGIGPFEVVELEGMEKGCMIKVAFARFGSLTIELNQPQGENNPRWEFLGNKAVRLHHIGFTVSDLKTQLERFKKLGLNITMRSDDAIGVAFVDTEEMAGVQ
jgi:4-hydroxyphenylpyruvate dioxygenase-like putative hemolysin